MTTCTALVPMDTQVIDAINIINNRIKPIMQVDAVASIKAVTKNICIDGALSVLGALGYCNDIFYYCKQKWNIYDIENSAWFPDYQGRMANELKICFFGGPPTKLNWYTGTLQTLVDDRVLYEIKEHGAIHVASIIGLDLTTDNQQRA